MSVGVAIVISLSSPCLAEPTAEQAHVYQVLCPPFPHFRPLFGTATANPSSPFVFSSSSLQKGAAWKKIVPYNLADIGEAIAEVELVRAPRMYAHGHTHLGITLPSLYYRDLQIFKKISLLYCASRHPPSFLFTSRSNNLLLFVGMLMHVIPVAMCCYRYRPVPV